MIRVAIGPLRYRNHPWPGLAHESGRGAHLTDPAWLEESIAAVDASLWDHLLDATGLRTFLDRKAREEWQERVLNDGSRFEVFKRYFDGPGLARELGGGSVLHDGDWFVAISA